MLLLAVTPNKADADATHDKNNPISITPMVFTCSSVKGSMPKVGDTVMVEASYNANMPFKWNAVSVQMLSAPALHQVNSTEHSCRSNSQGCHLVP